MHRLPFATLITALLCLYGSSGALLTQTPAFDVIIRGGTVYDGTGSAGRRTDVALRGDRIAGIGDFSGMAAGTVIDLTLLIVAFQSENVTATVGSARSGSTPPADELQEIVQLVVARIQANQ